MGIIKVVILHKRDGCFGGFGLHILIAYLLNHVAMAHLHVLLDHHIRTHEQHQPNDQTQSYLTHNLETAMHTLFVLLEHFNVVIGKTQTT